MIFVILPCYNEAPNLIKLIPKIGEVLKRDYTIIAVNDGSSDDTGLVLEEFSKKYPLIAIIHERNRGLQDALKSGLLKAVELGNAGDLVVTMDADDTHDPRYIPRLAEAIANADVCIASRYVKGGAQVNVPFLRVILSKGVNMLLRAISGIPAKDITSGYRMYRMECIKRIRGKLGEKMIESKGFEVSAELLTKAYYVGGCKTIVEIPITLDYGLKEGKSKMKVGKTIVRYVRLMFKVRKWRNMGGTRT